MRSWFGLCHHFGCETKQSEVVNLVIKAEAGVHDSRNGSQWSINTAMIDGLNLETL